jgi:hypothetical protein
MAFRRIETSLHQIQQIRFSVRSESILWVLRALRLPKTSLQRLRSSRFIPWPGCTKWVRMDFRHIETSIRRIQKSSFFYRSESRLWVLRAIRLLKTSLKRLSPSLFWMHRMKKMSWHGFWTTSNIDSSTSPKLFFKMLKIHFSGPFAYEIIISTTSSKSFSLNAQNVENAFEWPFDIMKHRFIDINKVAF